jgi:hypothetical protein
MRKITIKSIIEFRGKSDRSKQKYAEDIKQLINKEKIEGGGNYWVSSVSTICNSFKSNDSHYITDKIRELEEKAEKSARTLTKTMYHRNIDILKNFVDFDYGKWRPSKKIKFIKKNSSNSVLIIKGLHIQVNPHYLFSFNQNEDEEIGAIWFIAKLNGYTKSELGMFTDVLNRYLRSNYEKDYKLNPKYCIAVDVVKNFDVSYLQLQRGQIPSLLETTLDEINKITY